jgi:membrane protease YdiL (CAAX protease family)
MWLGLYVIKSAALTFALYHCLCLVPSIIMGRSLWQNSLLVPSLRDCAILFGVAILFSLFTVIGYEINGQILLSHESVLALIRQQGITGGRFIIFAIYATVVNPVLEELYWRGVVLNRLDSMKVPFKHFGIVWSSFSYALFHYLIFRLVLFPGWAEFGTVLLAVYGALLAVLYRKTGSIVMVAIAHGLLTDTACIVLLIYFFQRYGMP